MSLRTWIAARIREMKNLVRHIVYTVVLNFIMSIPIENSYFVDVIARSMRRAFALYMVGRQGGGVVGIDMNIRLTDYSHKF